MIDTSRERDGGCVAWLLMIVLVVAMLVAVRMHSDFRRGQFLEACMAQGAPRDYCMRVWEDVQP